MAIGINELNAEASGTSLYNSPQNDIITGYTHPEWEQDPGLFAKIIHEDDRRRVLDGFEAARIDGAPFVSEYRIVRPDGTLRHMQSITDPVKDESGRIVKLVGTLLDTTERIINYKVRRYGIDAKRFRS